MTFGILIDFFIPIKNEDLVSFIGGNFGLMYSGGSTKFSGQTPKKGKGSLTNWAWDWLPMYYYQFLFENVKDKEDQYKFCVFLLNDTGYFKAKETTQLNKTKLSGFTPSDKSSTKLIFTLGKNMWEDWGENWNSNEFVLEETGVKIHEENKRMVFKSYDLKDFANEDSAISKLKDFEDFCATNKIDFRVIEKKI